MLCEKWLDRRQYLYENQGADKASTVQGRVLISPLLPCHNVGCLSDLEAVR